MITLATLHEATAQQVFDQVAQHLKQQGEKSVSVGGQCSYRQDKLMCAAGCLISDEEYTPLMDRDEKVEKDSEVEYLSSTWNDLIKRKLVPSDHRDLITRLQGVHDASITGEGWFEEQISPGLKNTANLFGLEYKEA